MHQAGHNGASTDLGPLFLQRERGKWVWFLKIYRKTPKSRFYEWLMIIFPMKIAKWSRNGSEMGITRTKKSKKSPPYQAQA